MSSSISGTTIRLTRGDTFEADVSITNADGTPYEMQPGDAVRFRCTKKWGADTALIEKDCTSLVLALEPSDTSGLAFGEYKYDIQLTTAAGEVYTFVLGAFHVTDETDPREE